MTDYPCLPGIKFTDDDVVNIDDFDAYNGNRVWIFHDHGSVIGVVIMPDLQDALDELADSGKLDHLGVKQELVTFDEKDQCYRGPDGEDLSLLGNAGEPFDIDCLGIYELPMPKMSLVALLHHTD